MPTDLVESVAYKGAPDQGVADLAQMGYAVVDHTPWTPPGASDGLTVYLRVWEDASGNRHYEQPQKVYYQTVVGEQTTQHNYYVFTMVGTGPVGEWQDYPNYPGWYNQQLGWLDFGYADRTGLTTVPLQ